MAMMEKNKEFEKQDELREKYNELNSVKNMVSFLIFYKDLYRLLIECF